MYFSFSCVLAIVVTNTVLCIPNTTTKAPPIFVFKLSPFDFLSGEDAKLDLMSQILVLVDTYCRRSCSVDSTDVERSANPMCAPCYCDSRCYEYGDCCLDKYVRENRTRSPTVNVECVSHNYKSPESPYYYMTTSCPQVPIDDTTADLCMSNSTSSAMTAIPVTDENTNLTYRNKFCAECNGVSTYTFWKMYIECYDYDIFVTAKNLRQVYQKAAENPDCDIIFDPGEIDGVRKCSHYTEDLIDKCNVMGEWWYYDKRVETACDSFLYPVKRGEYKNVFCYVCNSPRTWPWLLKEKLQTDPGGLPLTALLDFDDSDVPDTSSRQQCSSEEFFDSYNCSTTGVSKTSLCYPVYGMVHIKHPLLLIGNSSLYGSSEFPFSLSVVLTPYNRRKMCWDICRKVLCPLGKVYKQGQCESLIDGFYFGYYIICMDVTMHVPLSDGPRLTEYVSRAVYQLETNIVSRFNDVISIYVRGYVRHFECNNKTVSTYYKLYLYLKPYDAPRDELERNLSQVFRKNLFSELYLVDNQTVEFSLSDLCPTWNHTDLIDYRICEGQPLIFESEDQLKYDTSNRYADLLVNDMLWCSQVELNSTEYSVVDNSSMIKIKATQLLLTQSEYQLTDEDTVKICLSDYQTEQTVLSPEISSTSFGLLSLICTSISLAFLTASVIVYAMVPYLRTDVSRNNITLALNLIIAQTLYEFGAELIHLPLICKIIGVLVHYFWLSSVFWMNSCTVNLFYKICFPFHSRGQSDVKVFLLLSLYSFISPGVIVMITSLSNYFVLGFSGYGRGICYLSNASSRIYGLAIPVGILVCANILLFLFTIITIYRLPNLKSTSTNKVSMIMCVNLSTITGASWLFGFAYEATGFIGFAYAFSIFLGSIGLFLFMTFFANKFKGSVRENVLSKCCIKPVTEEVASPAGTTGQDDVVCESSVHM